MTDIDPIASWTPPADMDESVVRGWRTFYRHIWSTYGVTPKQYRAVYLAQLGRCFICQKARGQHPDAPKLRPGARRLGIDHNHIFGFRPVAVRGLLCNWGDKSCNRIIGWIGYDALVRAQVYLREAPAQSVFAALEAGMSDEQIQGMALNP